MGSANQAIANSTLRSQASMSAGSSGSQGSAQSPGHDKVNVCSRVVEKLMSKNTVQGDPDFSSLGSFEVSPVDIDCSTMSDEKGVPYNPRFSRPISLGVFRPIACPARCVLSSVITENGNTPRLVEREPVFHLVAKGPECYTSVVGKISHKLVPVERAAVSLPELIRQVPVIKGDEWLDSCRMQVINELRIELNSLLVDGVVSASTRYDSWPLKPVRSALTGRQ